MQDHILIVDDDRQLTSFLERFFRKHGYKATTAGTASELFAAFERVPCDLVVLDLILPDEDGLEVAKRLRKITDVPIIMLTARDEVYDRIVGLELGADDYVTKPYEPRELLARVRSVLRRYEVGGKSKRADDAARYLRFGNIELDLTKSTAKRISDQCDLGLTSTEFALLRALAQAEGDVLSRMQILDTVYGHTVNITDRAIDAHMVRLRRKLADGNGEDLIQTVHGVGYKLADVIERA
ncbi:MAG: response regulator transcription factor [Pseudomonadota bacterium]